MIPGLAFEDLRQGREPDRIPSHLTTALPHYLDALLRMLSDEKTPLDTFVRRAWGTRQDEPMPTLGSIGMRSQKPPANAATANDDPETK